MCQNADIGPVHSEGHPHMLVHPIVGKDLGLIRVLEGNLARLTQRVPTMRIEHIPCNHAGVCCGGSIGVATSFHMSG